MEGWPGIIGPLIALLIGVALPLILRKRKKAEGSKLHELFQHFWGVGVQVSQAEHDDARGRIGLGSASGQKAEGVAVFEDRSIDSATVISTSTQYGTTYFINYLVKAPNISAARMLKRTRLTKRRSPLIWGRVMGIQWKGDVSLAQTLNFDYSLADRLLKADGKVVTGNIGIIPEPKHGYVRIKTDYSLPSAEAFEALCSIARHIKAW
ncbi:MAG: hypothetical protein ACNA7X_00195 [Dehalococcoidia bacterium]